MTQNDNLEKDLAQRLYTLDTKVYEATGSTMGKVFSSNVSIAIGNIIEELHKDKIHFLKNEMTLINNMIATMKDSQKTEPLKAEFEELKKDILAYSPEITLPHTINGDPSSVAKRFNHDNHLIICISRQFGTAGHTIGFKLANQLGIAYYDKEILNMACEHLDLDSQNIEDSLSDSGSSPLSYRKKRFSKVFSKQSDLLFFTQSNLICEMAEKESCVFMGRGADVILTNHHIPHLSIFLTAPFKERVKYEMHCSGTDYQTASSLVKKMDRSRKIYYHNYTGRHWGHAENYDLCINTFFYGEKETMRLIENMINLADFDRQ